MGWLYLVAALVFPPAFILWRPRAPVPAARMKIRVAAAVVVVWMLIILWSVGTSVPRGPAGSLRSEPVTTGPDASEQWEADAPSEMPLVMLLGWVPGLVYAGLLLLARKGLEVPGAEVVDAPGRRGQRS